MSYFSYKLPAATVAGDSNSGGRRKKCRKRRKCRKKRRSNS